ncbi:glycosyltransferase [Pantoea sp. EA-12]|uniref:glycosyltransferase n=1 Tax=Pantoea sp. EA-12 TaxID=3043303 RepID=UPI0024B5D0C2|nr:glycosyltransferase [Pantoea sp. EA-12]MDI9221131.1 glycosyltransferase [Pantoea sp. EA-12]
MEKIISVLNTITTKSGGLTKVSLTRCKAFLDKGIESFVVTTDYDAKFKSTISQMKDDGRIDRRVSVVNLYLYYAFANLFKSVVDDVVFHMVSSLPELKGLDREINRLEIKNTIIITYKDVNGKVFLIEVENADGEFLWGILQLEGRNDYIFSSRSELHTYWLEELCSDNKKTVLISDQPICCDAVLAVKNKNAFSVLTIHNNHFRPPYTLGSNVNDRYGNILSGMPFADSIVILTERQKEHILEQYQDRGNLFVIGNPLTKFERQENIKKEKFKCVAVCRLVPMKNIKEMIDIFVMVHGINASFSLDVWGSGVMQEELIEYVKEKSAENYIKFMGYTATPDKVLSQASISLATSTFEGFGVSFAESLSLGTPVISYKTLYGPEEIISDGIDGYLVDNQEDFIARVIELGNNDTLRINMGLEGIKNMERFSNEGIVDKWLEMFRDLEREGAKNSLRNLENVSFVNFSYNVTGSAYGWVYLSKDDVLSNKYVMIDGANLQVIKVHTEKNFKGERVSLIEGDYSIDSLEFIKERNDYRFKLRKGQFVYTGALGMKCLKLRIAN